MHRVLIIDDSKIDRVLYGEWLSGANYSVDFAEDGDIGLASTILEGADCIILDFLMDQLDGFQFLSKLRRLHRISTPVIFLTGHGSKEIREDALAMGADSFLSKQEVNAERLMSEIEMAFSKKQLM